MWGTVFNWHRSLALLNTILKVWGYKISAVYQMSNFQILNVNSGFYILINKAGNARTI